MEGLLCLMFLLAAMTGRSGATYCLCKDGLSDSALQKTLDYACGAGADCSPILQNGACYLPNTVKDHCSYAANSYYQRKNQSGATCDFSGTAYSSQTPPSSVASGCVYPSSSSTGGSTPPPPPSTTNSNTTYNTPPYSTGISPSDSGSGSGRETISFFNAVAALVSYSFGHLAAGLTEIG